MKGFIEVTLFDNIENKRRIIIPKDNIACIDEEKHCRRIFLKNGKVEFYNVQQTYEQIMYLLN